MAVVSGFLIPAIALEILLALGVRALLPEQATMDAERSAAVERIRS